MCHKKSKYCCVYDYEGKDEKIGLEKRIGRNFFVENIEKYWMVNEIDEKVRNNSGG